MPGLVAVYFDEAAQLRIFRGRPNYLGGGSFAGAHSTLLLAVRRQIGDRRALFKHIHGQLALLRSVKLRNVLLRI